MCITNEILIIIMSRTCQQRIVGVTVVLLMLYLIMIIVNGVRHCRRTDHSLDEVVADDANARMSFTLGKSDSWTAGKTHTHITLRCHEHE